METKLAAGAHGRSFLLELLQLAGWQVQVRDGAPPRIRARRDEVELEVTGVNFTEAAGTMFAQAMRSARPDRGD
jgi:hypothetical protein